MRIAVGGIGHETNTFSTLRTRLDDFGVRRGEEVTRGPFWDGLRAEGVEWAPTLTAGAGPHGLVERSAYVQLRDELLDRLRASLPVDGVYLSLHGAMEVEEIGDGESDLVGSIRQVVGPEVPISASLDLHGNIAPALVRQTNILTALRTAPHRDGEETRRRAVAHLVRCVREGRRPVTAMVKVPLLLPGEYAVTEVEPARSLYAWLEEIEREPGVLDASLMIGCAWTDSPHTSVSVLVVAERDAGLARQHAARLAAAVWDRRDTFRPDVETTSMDEAVSRALAAPESPVFISDSGDNVTAGGAGDLPHFVAALLAAEDASAAVAGIADPEAVSACAAAGLNAPVTLTIGGKLDAVNGRPLPAAGTVIGLVPPEDPSLAVLRVGGVDVVLTTDRRAFTSYEDFRRAGLDPEAYKAVVVKLGYLFADLRDRAPRTIMALSPGFTDLRLEALPFRRVQRPIYPLDRDFAWSAPEA